MHFVFDNSDYECNPTVLLHGILAAEKGKYAYCVRSCVGIYCHSTTIDTILRYDNCFRYERRVAAQAGAPCLDPTGILFTALRK